MAVGERIHFFRTMRGLTQRAFGKLLGFPERSADVRLAQYETGTRTPKADLTNAMAEILEVSPNAIAVPDIDSYIGLMHTLFTLEDRYGLYCSKQEGEICLKVNVRQNRDADRLHEMLCAWQKVSEDYESSKISREEYDRWRYNYPRFDQTRPHARVISQGLSDLLND